MNMTIVARNLALSCGVASTRSSSWMRAARSPITPSTASTSSRAPRSPAARTAGRSTPTAARPVTVTIAGNTVRDYQKSGIEARGPVNATITDNVVDGWGTSVRDEQDRLERRSRRLRCERSGREATRSRTTGTRRRATTACGLLLYQAGGVKQKANAFVRERDESLQRGPRGWQHQPLTVRHDN